MEAFIVMVIIGLISSFFNKKGEQKKPAKPMPPFNNPSAPPKPAQQQTSRPKSLEDFANEIFGQLNGKSADVRSAPVEVPATLAQPVEAVQQERPASTRPPLAERPLVQKLKQESAFQVVPKNQQQVMQAVVMAEILGKPKAKR